MPKTYTINNRPILGDAAGYDDNTIIFVVFETPDVTLRYKLFAGNDRQFFEIDTISKARVTNGMNSAIFELLGVDATEMFERVTGKRRLDTGEYIRSNWPEIEVDDPVAVNREFICDGLVRLVNAIYDEIENRYGGDRKLYSLAVIHTEEW